MDKQLYAAVDGCISNNCDYYEHERNHHIHDDHFNREHRSNFNFWNDNLHDQPLLDCGHDDQ